MAKSKARIFADLADKYSQISTTATGTSISTVDTVQAVDTSAIVFNIMATKGTDFQYCTVVVAMTSATDCDFTQFSDIQSSELVTFTADSDVGPPRTLRLRATPTTTGTLNLKITRIGVAR
jgi:predicted HAD superfamily phosphohydrolase